MVIHLMECIDNGSRDQPPDGSFFARQQQQPQINAQSFQLALSSRAALGEGL
jgi:hypothetical protein